MVGHPRKLQFQSGQLMDSAKWVWVTKQWKTDPDGFYFECLSIPFFDLFWHFFGCLRFAVFWVTVSTFTRNCQKSCSCLKFWSTWNGRTQKLSWNLQSKFIIFHPMVNNLTFPLASPEEMKAYPPRQIHLRFLCDIPWYVLSTDADYFFCVTLVYDMAIFGATPCRVSSFGFCSAAGGTSWSTAWRTWRCFWPQP